MKKSLIFLFIGFIGIIISFLRLEGDIKNFVIVICIFFSFLPYIIENNLIQKREREKEEKFLEFIRDILENVKTGTPINKAILNVQNRDYGALSSHIKKLANQISLGFPLSNALENFANEVKNDLVFKTIDLISESNRSGGEISSILSTVADSINQTQIIKKERKSSVVNLQVQGYIIFIIFIVIVIILQFFLIPKLISIGKEDGNYLGISPENKIDFSRIMTIILVIESFFSGLVIGKIAEGKISYGIKHSFILVSISLISFFAAKIIF